MMITIPIRMTGVSIDIFRVVQLQHEVSRFHSRLFLLYRYCWYCSPLWMMMSRLTKQRIMKTWKTWIGIFGVMNGLCYVDDEPLHRVRLHLSRKYQ